MDLREHDIVADLESDPHALPFDHGGAVSPFEHALVIGREVRGVHLVVAVGLERCYEKHGVGDAVVPLHRGTDRDGHVHVVTDYAQPVLGDHGVFRVELRVPVSGQVQFREDVEVRLVLHYGPLYAFEVLLRIRGAGDLAYCDPDAHGTISVYSILKQCAFFRIRGHFLHTSMSGYIRISSNLRGGLAY